MAQQKHNIAVLLATEKDALTLSHIESIAFDTPPPARARTTTKDENEKENENETAPSPTLGRLMFGPPSAEKDALSAKDLVEKMKSSPETRIYKAVLLPDGGAEAAEGKIVGYATWKFYTSPFPEEDTWTDLPWEMAANPAACNEFFGGIARLRTKHMGGKKFAFLSLLVIHPNYQGIGIGGKMLQRGLDDAAALGLEESYLEATDAGHPLYTKFGWRDVEAFPTDLTKYGGKGVWNTVAMRRGGE